MKPLALANLHQRVKGQRLTAVVLLYFPETAEAAGLLLTLCPAIPLKRLFSDFVFCIC